MILSLLAILLIGRGSINEDYVLQVGDRVAISVIGAVNFTYNQTISPQGNIFLQSPTSASFTYSEITPTQVQVQVQTQAEEVTPVIEAIDIVHVTGLSIAEAREFLEKQFKNYFKDIKVELNVIMFTDQVYVSGAVALPQAYPFLPNRKAQEYIGMAGGLTNRAVLRKSFVIARDGTRKPLEETIIEKGDTIVIKEVSLEWPKDYITIASPVTSVVSAITSVIIVWLSRR